MSRIVLALVAPAVMVGATTASAQASRDTAVGEMKFTTLTVEYGQPEWNDGRLSAMEQQIPVGSSWRTGADGTTTLTVEGGPCFFGNHLVEPGTYGLNVRRTEENHWNLILFEQPNAGMPMHRGVRSSWEAAGKMKSDAEVADKLMFEFSKDDGLIMKFGPIRVMAPVSDVNEMAQEVTLNGVQASGAAYRRPAGIDLSTPQLAGYLEMEVDGNDCSMRYYVSMADGKMTVTFRHAELERCQRMIAETDAALSLLQGQGGGNPQVDAIIASLERRKMKSEIVAEDYEGMPDKLSYDAAAQESGGASSLVAKVVRKGDALSVDVKVGKMHASIPLNEGDFAPKGE